MDEELNISIVKYMYSNKEKCKNKEENLDKRIAAIRILKEYFETKQK